MDMRTIRISLAWALLSALAATAAETKKAAPSISDQALQQTIQEKFSKSKAGGGKFTVRVQSGVAYLSGRADVVQHKGAATRMAKTAGAKRVVNNIVVTEAAKQKAARSMERGKPRVATVKPSA
jgi:osmotically-inducible protein OsmY